MAMGSFSIILLLGLLSGGGSIDIISTLPAKDYFKARDIEVTGERLMALAAQKPETAKLQIGQLFALSHLAAEPELVKKSAKAALWTMTLKDIADGKLAADPAGFAAIYAQKTLRAVQGEKDPAPAKGRWPEALTYLPENATLVGHIDMTAGATGHRRPLELGQTFALLPKESLEQLWLSIEKIGNVQIDSVGFAYSELAGKNSELVVRFTGRANPHWFLTVMDGEYSRVMGNAPARVTPTGEKVAMYVSNKTGPSMAIIGNNEILIGGLPLDFNNKEKKYKHEEVLTRLLDARGKSNGPLGGVLKADFAKVPADATGLLVGTVPKEVSEGAPMPIPVRIVAHAKRTAGGIDFVANGAMADAEAAKSLVAMIGGGRDAALQQLNMLQGKQIPGAPPGFNIGSIIGLLESVQLQSNGGDAQVRVLVPDEVLSMVPIGAAVAIPAQQRFADPPPKKE